MKRQDSAYWRRRSLMLSTARTQAGLTLIELLIAITIGLIILAAIVGVFISNNKTYRENDALATMQDNARFALDLMGRDLQMAGFLGGIRPLDATFNIRRSSLVDTAVPAANQCGPNPSTGTIPWLFDLTLPVDFRDHLPIATSASSITARYRCLTDPKLDSDIVAIRRVAGVASASIAEGSTTTPTLAANRIYLVANSNIGSLIQWPATGGTALGALVNCPDSTGTPSACQPTQAPVSYWAFSPRIYYVQNNSGKPRLCRAALPDVAATGASLPAAPAMTIECLADGIENIQFEWGFDTDGDAANTVDRFESVPTSPVDSALAVRISIIVRGDQNVALSSDGRTFTNVANYSDTAAVAGVFRRSYSTTVQLKNNRLQ